MAAFVKYNCFVEDVAEKKHNLGSDALKIALTNTAPNVATHAVLADITEITAQNGYTAGGVAAPIASSAQTGGIYKLTPQVPGSGGDPVFTATAGGFGPFRYAVLYNSTAAGGPLIGYWDYGQSITLANAGETFTVDLDQTNGILTLQ